MLKAVLKNLNLKYAVIGNNTQAKNFIQNEQGTIHCPMKNSKNSKPKKCIKWKLPM
jgi:hypothetical protein